MAEPELEADPGAKPDREAEVEVEVETAAQPAPPWWRALWDRRPKRGGQAVVLVAAALAAFLAVGQLRSSPPFSQQLQNEDEGDLARILAGLSTNSDQLRDELASLKLQLLAEQTSSQRDDAASQADAARLQGLEVLAGTIPVTGPGIVVTVRDPNQAVGYDLMVDLVQELRDAGAEAISVGGQRVGALTAFGAGAGGKGVTVDGVPIDAPYGVAAIGQPATLDGGLAIPGGALDTLRAQAGVQVEVARSTKVDLPALAQPPAFKVARPVGSPP